MQTNWGLGGDGDGGRLTGPLQGGRKKDHTIGSAQGRRHTSTQVDLDVIPSVTARAHSWTPEPENRPPWVSVPPSGRARLRPRPPAQELLRTGDPLGVWPQHAGPVLRRGAAR